MSQPKLCTPHGTPVPTPIVQPSPRSVRFARPAVVTVLGVADADVVPLGAED